MTSDPVIRALETVREKRRHYLNLKAACDARRAQGMRPSQYESELKQLNDAKGQFFWAIQKALDESTAEIERQECNHAMTRTNTAEERVECAACGMEMGRP